MNSPDSVFDVTHFNHFCVFLAAIGVWLVVNLIIRRIEEGLPSVARGTTAFALAAAVYCGGMMFIMPNVSVLDSFDRSEKIADVQDHEKLFKLLQAQHTALVKTIIIQEQTAQVLFLVSLTAGILGLRSLARMRSGQQEKHDLNRRPNSGSNAESEN